MLNSIYGCILLYPEKRRCFNAMSISSVLGLSHLINKVTSNQWTDHFNINAAQFLALAQKEGFVNLKQNLVQINIQDALACLTPQSYFEVTIPVLGMTDFLANHFKNSTWNELAQPFASILSINGFGGGNFPRPDFIMVKDIIGNQYEILVDSNGQVEIPQEGIGLFSMLSEITLMYSFEQVIRGHGLESLIECGAQSNYLDLLAPPNLSLPFHITIRVLHLDENRDLQVDFEEKHLFRMNPENQYSGLTEFGARTLMRNLFSEFDFLRCLLSDNGEQDFFIAHTNHFNDFKISPEAVGIYYDLLLKSIIHQRLPSQFLLSKVPVDRIKMLDLKYAPLDEADQQLIKKLGVEALWDLSQHSPRIPVCVQKTVLPSQSIEKTESIRKLLR